MEAFILEWHWFFLAADLIIDILTTVHVVLYKRDSRSAIGWVGVIWLTPLIGCLFYYVLGINRIQRHARRLRRRTAARRERSAISDSSAEDLAPPVTPEVPHLSPLIRLVHAITGQPLLPGNRVQPLYDGDQAYPAMLQAIADAKSSVTLSTYIFDNDCVGRLFVDALQQAVARGVEVRVLIDDVGAHYTWPSVLSLLRRTGVPAARFLPKLVPWGFAYANLCTHRKLLVVDGRIAFTGGMNLREGHRVSCSPKHPIRDVQFRVDGPAVDQLQGAFVDDWEFCTGEVLEGQLWFPGLTACGPVLARRIVSGPDDDLDKLRMVYLGALASARRHVWVVTPYFLPDAGLISALNVAALRGVQVDIVLPEQNNLRLVQWASMAQLWQVLEHGCRVWTTPPPFDHTKLLLVDGVWTLFGSANWDPRSLRLNFELDVECYDRALNVALEAAIHQRLQKARPITLTEVQNRPLLVKLRDGFARLLTPYL